MTATRILDAINAYGRGRYQAGVAFERDYRTIVLSRPRSVSPVRFIAEIGELLVEPDTPARVDRRRTDGDRGDRPQRADLDGRRNPWKPDGSNYRSADRFPAVAVLAARRDGRGTPQTFIDVNEPGANVAILRGTDLQRLVRGLNQIGLKPTGIIAILQAIKAAGALQADLVIQ